MSEHRHIGDIDPFNLRAPSPDEAVIRMQDICSVIPDGSYIVLRKVNGLMELEFGADTLEMLEYAVGKRIQGHATHRSCEDGHSVVSIFTADDIRKGQKI